MSHSGHVSFRVHVPNGSANGAVVVCGETDSLGDWEPACGAVLTAVSGSDGRSFEGAVGVESATPFVEYKYVVRRSDSSVRWEGGDNRVITLARGGGVEVVIQDETRFADVRGEAANVATPGAQPGRSSPPRPAGPRGLLLVDRLMKTFSSPSR
jgi:Starch binding domain